ncbi:MAG: phosphoglucomutase/phosphomannomutase family protein [Armatimonadota bacterium]|nr:phosphoglucomutase/phosphomannomutase family protein [Armatimonadota bacterium]
MNVSIKFGTDGWRAVMAREFTFDNVALVAQAIASYVRAQGNAERGVVIGYDARLLSDLFADLIADVLTANGIPAFVTDRDTPTPVTVYTIRAKGLAGAVMLTASHNPPQYNGIKFIPPTCHPALPETTDAIEEQIAYCQQHPECVKRDGNPSLKQKIDPRPDYFAHLHQLLDTRALAGLKVVFDPLYATGRGYVDGFLREVGARVETIKGERNPAFGGSLPDPNPQNLQLLSERVRETGAHLGLATDGDADRFGVVDADGEMITANQVIVLTLWYLLRKMQPESGHAVRTVATTHQIDALARSYGSITVHETPVGFKWVGSTMARTGALVGGEESGGLSVTGHIPEKDGILADLLMAEMVAKEGVTLKHALAQVAQQTGEYHTQRIDLHVNESVKNELMRRFRERPPASLNGLRVVGANSVDGVKLLLEEEAWVLVRPSGTEPLIRCYVEAHDEETLEGLKEAMHALVAAGT